MGMGKTVSTLTALEMLIRIGEAKKILIIAPLRVARDVWPAEIRKWDHLKSLTFSSVIGNERARRQGLFKKADIYLINREQVVWLISHYGTAFPFDTVVIDELSSFKSKDSARFKALRRVRPLVKRVIGLTGTPAPNTLLDLWPQMYLLDQGERLGKRFEGFRDKYFEKRKSESGWELHGYQVKQLSPKEKSLLGGDIYSREIYDKVSDICISMKSEDYLKLPPLIFRPVIVNLSDGARMKYKKFEREKVMELMEDQIVTAMNAAALSNKLQQCANGAVYDEDKNVLDFHKEKLEALEEILDTAAGQPVLIFYWFQHDLARLRQFLARYSPRVLKTEKDMADWNNGRISVAFAHPGSAGHGLNLQDGGNILIWFSLTWSLELFQQACKRLHRKGQLHPVIAHMLVAEGTIDERIVDVLEGKAESQNGLMEAIKAIVKEYRPKLKVA
jgi:SNF2 family DNA or RNA helicase